MSRTSAGLRPLLVMTSGRLRVGSFPKWGSTKKKSSGWGDERTPEEKTSTKSLMEALRESDLRRFAATVGNDCVLDTSNAAYELADYELEIIRFARRTNSGRKNLHVNCNAGPR